MTPVPPTTASPHRPSPDQPSLDRLPLDHLVGVGPGTKIRLTRLELFTVQDLLFHFPIRYEDRTRVTRIEGLIGGTTALIQGSVTHVRTGPRHQLIVDVSDGTGVATLVFFHFAPAQRAALRAGLALRCWGEVRASMFSTELIHPEYQLRDRPEHFPPIGAELTAVYPTTDGLPQSRLRALVSQALGLLSGERDTAIDRYVRTALPTAPGYFDALHTIHQPATVADAFALDGGTHIARLRLAFEELLAQQVAVLRNRRQQRAARAPELTTGGDLILAIESVTPFRLTRAQRRVIHELDTDLAAAHPMLRLVQGDVGCGKTIVAAHACLRAIRSGYQAAVMVPTEVLAEQHLRSFSLWLAPLGVRVAMLLGRRPSARQRRLIRERLAAAEIDLIIGTQALIQSPVEFARLGLVIIDEQHRFGVRQRLELKAKGAAGGNLAPHQLVLTATPIPRTLAQTAYADLDVSIIDELPPGRLPVTTVSVPDSRREEVIARIAAACHAGRQAYWVCPLIEVSDKVAAEAAEETVARLRADLPGLRIGLAHGRLPGAERSAVLASFAAGELALLVATTVIEVGVDVPNASVMVIENAERLGLAQLHQLRGRVGRGSARSHCVLLYAPPLSRHSRARLALLRETNDGFRIAEKDLELRGAGEVLGTRQTGEVHLRAADLLRDHALLPAVQQLAPPLLDESELLATLEARWLPGAQDYVSV